MSKKIKEELILCVIYECEYKIARVNCFLGHFIAFISHINLRLINLVFLGLIIIISIFGRIKGSYKWFILNQVVWDFIISWDYHCDNLFDSYDPYFGSDWSCTYRDWDFWNIIPNSISTNTYSALLLLTFTRFLSLYFTSFYDKITAKRKILYLIIIFNFLNIFTNLRQPFYELADAQYSAVINRCIDEGIDEEECQEIGAKDSWRIVLEKIYEFIGTVTSFKPALFVALSVIFAGFLVAKISKQFKFQWNNNRKDFLVSLRITAVIIFQICVNFIVAILETLYLLSYYLFYGSYEIWLGTFGLGDEYLRSAIIQVRIFLEALAILLIMAGYREAIVKGVTWMYKKILRKDYGLSRSKVTILKNEKNISTANSSAVFSNFKRYE